MTSQEVMLKYAYIKNRPIHTVEDGTRTFPIVFRAEGDDAIRSLYAIHSGILHKESTRELIQGYGSVTAQEMYNFYTLLSDRLLSFGGKDVILPDLEEEIEGVLNYGQLWYGDKVDNLKLEAHRCHSNSSNVWQKDRVHKDIHIVTGYALNLQGFWVQHTWLVEKRPRSIRIIETTVSMLAYYGVVLTDAECEVFSSYY